ncbi:uncharacterized protein LOC120534736 [Polypterus senegalus]|uniref:uncharacterized protein LOC120534736 n=1 Tax=Polypterus senegalus TaxID=55291 RepID=UPI0019624C95|nr:uncharacterized protein LOC120534736 [Polypterus senegalus]
MKSTSGVSSCPNTPLHQKSCGPFKPLKMKPGLWSVRTVLRAVKCPLLALKLQAQHLGVEICRHLDLDMQQEVVPWMAIALEVGPAEDPDTGPGHGTVVRGTRTDPGHSMVVRGTQTGPGHGTVNRGTRTGMTGHTVLMPTDVMKDPGTVILPAPPMTGQGMVLQIARIGGKNTKDCVHKVLDRLFSNALMVRFNMKGKGKRGKKPLENTKVYRAI